MTCKGACKLCCTAQRQAARGFRSVPVSRKCLQQILSVSDSLYDNSPRGGLRLGQKGPSISFLFTDQVQNQNHTHYYDLLKLSEKNRSNHSGNLSPRHLESPSRTVKHVKWAKNGEELPFLHQKQQHGKIYHVLAAKDNQPKWSLVLLIQHRNKRTIKYKKQCIADNQLI